jgi:predicted RNase H-like HicB family nuclease
MTTTFVWVAFCILCLISLLIGLYFGYAIGYNTIASQLEANGVGFEEPEPSKRYMTIEMTDGVYYAYDKESKAFMAQGESEEELYNNLVERFPEFTNATFKMNKVEKNESV